MTIAQIDTLVNALEDGGLNTAAEVRAVLNAIKNECCKLYEVKNILVNLTEVPDFITNNFDETGLGINDYEGFIILADAAGRTFIGYDPENYPDIGEQLGSANTVLVSHTHTYKDTLFPQTDTVTVDYADGSEAISTGINKEGTAGDNNNDTIFYMNRTTDATTAEDGVGKNIQPSIVTLFIQRIA